MADNIVIETCAIKYKQMVKSQLFREIVNLYNSRSLVELRLATDLYLDYFGKFSEKNTRLVKFYKGFANYSHDKPLAISTFEDLLRDGELDETTRFYSECNLTNLYPNSDVAIPKIIHLIYFKERDLCAYHLRCIKSILRHMPDYKIMLHNDIEPIGNVCWDELKTFSQIEVVYRERPRHFDGFDLKYVQYQADVARLEILYEFGGIYLDLDILVLRNFTDLFKSDKSFYISRETGDHMGLINSFLAAKPKNEFLKIWLDSFKTGLRMESWAYHIRDTNKQLIGENPHYKIKYGIEILDHHHFFPVPWTDQAAFENKKTVVFKETTYGVHLFDTILHNILVKNAFFPDAENRAGSFYQEFLSQIVDKIVVLTLKNRPDRQEQVSAILNQHKIPYEFMKNDLHETSPVLGCFQSHIKAIKYAKEKGFRSILICEDDIIINPSCMNYRVADLPQSWDMLYLGGILTSYGEKTDKWVKGTIWCNHAYIVKDHMYDVILEEYEKCDQEQMANLKQNIDWFYTDKFHSKYQCWLAIDQPIIQSESYSDIDGKLKWANGFDWSTFTMKQL